MRLAIALAASLALFAASPGARVSRVSLAHMERSIDTRVAVLDAEDRGLVLGRTRGVYLDGYGVVFTAEVDLLPSVAPNPFSGQTYTKEDILRIKGKKQLKIALLKQKMRDTLISAAAPLDNVPGDERIAMAVTIPYYSWEDSTGLPKQILMTAPRNVLLKGSKGDTLAVDNAVKVEEFF